MSPEEGAEAWNRRQVLSLGGRLLAGGAAVGAATTTAACTESTAPSPPAPSWDGSGDDRSPKSAPRPNIVLIVLDDAGYGDFGPQSSSPMIRTPRMDQIAEEGLHFTQMYAGAPVCSPSRAALLTGRYAQRVGIPAVLPAQGKTGLSEYEKTVAELLHQVGYRTGAFGKWHLGSRPRYNPLRHGFEDYFGLLHSNDQKPLRLHRDRTTISGDVNQRSLTRRYTDEAIRFIDKHRNEPFFVYLPHTAPHVPLHVEPRFQNTSPAGEYGDTVQGIDFHIGRVLDKLDALGLRENTMVMVTSDNGPWYQGSTNGLRGRKTTSYEGGVRVPFLLRWPRQVKTGSVCEDPASFLDMMPTFVNLAGGAVPTDRPIDGLDITPVLRQRPMPPRKALYYFQEWSIEAVRAGPWKLHLPRRKQSKHQRQLYNIKRDPTEQYDLGSDHPRVVQHLTTLAGRFQHEITEQRPEAIRRARGN